MTALEPATAAGAEDSRPVALITGAASGIGAACAVDAARRGMDVVVGFHQGDRHHPDAVVAAVRAAGGRAVAQRIDVRDGDAVAAAAARAIQGWGRLDVVVANAGVLRQATLAELDDAAWEDMLAVDLGGVMRTFRATAPHLKRGGAMVAVSSVSGGVYGWSEHSHYAAAKAGILGLVRSLAIELAPRGIRVNTVVPGTIDTPQAQDPTNSLGPEGIERVGRSVPLGRAGRAVDVAAAIGFLASPEASYITGTTLVVDGGMTAVMPG